MEDPSNS